MPLNTFITTPKTPTGSSRCTAANDSDFQKPSTRSETASAVAKISEKPKKCTVCQGTNQMTWLISNSILALQPSRGSVGRISAASRISGWLIWPPRWPVSAMMPSVTIANSRIR